jgi:hypothetical protein
MQATVYADLTNRRLTSTLGGGAISFPAFVQGDKVRIGLRFAESIEGSPVEVQKTVTHIRASIGFVDARPASGSFILTANGIDTAPISHDATAGTVQAALVEAGLPDVVVSKQDGSWIISTGGAEINLTGTSAGGLLTELRPVSFVRIRSTQVAGQYRHEIRLVQAPLASTASFETIVPPAPTITEVQEGGSSATTIWPEIQALKIQPTFKGTYQLRRGFRKTRELSVDDGPEEIQDALSVLADDEGSFSVTNPATHIAHITFNGSMAGIDQDLLEVAVFSAPPGDPTVILDLNTAEIAAALRGAAELKPDLEIEVAIQDENDPNKTHTLTPFRAPITLIRELNWEGLETAANIDWLRPPYGRSYVPFTPDQIITGSQHHVSVIGDGGNQEFTISHNLGTRDLHVTLRRNGGDLAIIQPVAVTLDSEDDLTVTFASAPALNEFVAIISTAGPVSAFQAHGHTIAQIDGLQLMLDDLGGRVETLESFIPSGSLGMSESKDQTIIASWELPELFEVFPTRAKVEAKDVPSIKPGELPRVGGLLPAVYPGPVLRDYFVQTPAGHLGTNPADYGKLVYFGDVDGSHVWHGEYNSYDDVTGEVTEGTTIYRDNAASRWVLSGIVPGGETPLMFVINGPVYAVPPGGGNGPPESPPLTGWASGFALAYAPLVFDDPNGLPSLPDAGVIYGHYNTGVDLTLPGYLGRRSTKLEAPATYTHDGRGFYQVEPMNADELVFYPKDFERELFRIHVNEKQLRLGKTLRLDFSFVAAVFKSNTSVQWGVAIDIGLPSADPASPSNIADVTFLPPSLDHTFMLTAVPSSHNFGLRVQRKIVDSVDTCVVDRIIYGAIETTPTALTSANFIVRGRLVRFDTDNHETDPRGLVAFHGLKATLVEGGDESEFGKATIQ